MRGIAGLSLCWGLLGACADDSGVNGGTPESTSSAGSSDSGLNTGSGFACIPTANDGRGLGFAEPSEPGVWCASEACPFGCDLRALPQCNPDAGIDDYGADAYCDDPEDCDEGALCCVEQVFSGIPRSASTCVAGDTCPEGSSPACNDDGDCATGACIRANSNQGALDLGVCRETTPSACIAGPEADCSGADLRGADLSGADLHGANLCQADLSNATLYDATLDGAVLTDAQLGGAELHQTSLRYADLSRADLTGANLFDLDLTGADLTGALLSGTLASHVTCPDGVLVREAAATFICDGHLLPE